MGIGVSLAFIAVGAILAFALRVDLSGVDIRMVGWILILVGLVSLFFTFRYTRPRRSADPVAAGTDPLYVERPDEADPVVHEERVIERPTEPHVERVERIIERPVPPPSTTPQGHSAQDPAVAQDPEYAQDPAVQNNPPLTSEPGRVPSEPGRRTRRNRS
ncbi:DUF6458 family protein [Actinomadura miaoliensis]|uniref:DUF6458 domain-containing protein n=1 Tax=Actinomadura miaoliensis TaxID=430685 RepID=A0ABP7V836_9ACTN